MTSYTERIQAAYDWHYRYYEECLKAQLRGQGISEEEVRLALEEREELGRIYAELLLFGETTVSIAPREE